jgi:eukaryotic-like serine/threonine-protein kinase
MNQERWQRIEQLYHAALERDADQRTSFLAQACADDASLYREVELLLAANEQADEFLATPALESEAKNMVAEKLSASLGIQAGQELSHYKILERLGAGGMGEVYLAEDTKLNRPVAIKLLPQDAVSDEKAKRRLIQEAQAAAKLDHPNICAIYDVGELEETFFIVMQYVEGETLAERMRVGTISIEQSLDAAIQIAEALCEAHSRGIVHRDIKPLNIMITSKGLVKILDFGLAKFIRESALSESQADTASMLTTPGMIIGTLPYMSPEQLRGESIDDRSDIFSFGVVLYEAVSGKHPFRGETSATTSAYILMKEPRSLREVAPQVPPELDIIINKALAKNREDRYQTSTEMLSDLSDLTYQIGITRASKGYSLRAPLADSRATPPVQTGAASRRVTERPEEALTQGQRQTWSHRIKALSVARRAFVIGAIFFAIACAALFFMMRGSFGGTATINSIAVLPFTDINPAPEMEYLSDGITETLIKSLSQMPNMKVISSSSVFRYKGQDIDPQAIGSTLKVEAVITGKIIQRGENLTISVELVDTSDRSRIWGRTFSRKATDIFLLENDIARQVTDNLQLKLSGEDKARLNKQHTDNPEAYRYYLQGRYYWNKVRGGALRKAIENYQKAIDIDPDYALAYAGIAESWVLGGGVSLPPSEYILKAKDAAEQALRLDDTLVEARTTLAKVKSEYEWKWDEAEAEFKRAIEINPNYATAYVWYADHLTAMRRLEEATTMLRRAYELDPLSLNVNANLGLPLFYGGQYKEAIAAFQRALDMDPSFIPARDYLGNAYAANGMYKEAISEFEKVLSVAKGYYPALAMLGYCHARAGRKAEAERVLEKLVELSKTGHISTLNMVIIYTGIGDVEKAIEWLLKMYEARAGYLIYLKVHPVFASLRSHPRFQEMVTLMKLP